LTCAKLGVSRDEVKIEFTDKPGLCCEGCTGECSFWMRKLIGKCNGRNMDVSDVISQTCKELECAPEFSMRMKSKGYLSSDTSLTMLFDVCTAAAMEKDVTLRL
jgi:hypothetical protein